MGKVENWKCIYSNHGNVCTFMARDAVLPCTFLFYENYKISQAISRITKTMLGMVVLILMPFS